MASESDGRLHASGPAPSKAPWRHGAMAPWPRPRACAIAAIFVAVAGGCAAADEGGEEREREEAGHGQAWGEGHGTRPTATVVPRRFELGIGTVLGDFWT